MDRKMKQSMGLVTLGVTLYAALFHLDVVLRGISYVGNLIAPVLIGLILAFILNVPVTGIEKRIERLFAGKKRQPAKNTVHMASIALTLLGVVLVFVVLGTLVIPELMSTVRGIIDIVEQNWPTWLTALENTGFDTSALRKKIEGVNIRDMIKKYSSHAAPLIGSIADAATSTGSTILTAISGLVIALYVLGSRDTLARQAKKMLYAYGRKPAADRIHYNILPFSCNLCDNLYRD